jgi:hypothetical protein
MKDTRIRKMSIDEQGYEMLRSIHANIKDFLDEDLNAEQRNAIETLHGLLYLVEGKFLDF